MVIALKRRIIGALTDLGMLEMVNEARGLGTLLSPKTILGNRRCRNGGSGDGWPIPPARLIYLVAGTYNVEWFLALGRRGHDAITDTLRRNKIDPRKFEAMLDFGCGCGRVIRHFSDLKNVEICGTDYNGKLIGWCRENLTFAKFGMNELSPPLDYPDSKFDFAYALSVFTHWGQDLEFAWMDEIRRVIKPGGHLLMTTHGQSYLPGLSDDERRRFNGGELVVRRAHLAGKNICTTFFSEAYVRENLSRGCRVVDFVPEGARGNPTQDLYLLRFE